MLAVVLDECFLSEKEHVQHGVSFPRKQKCSMEFLLCKEGSLKVDGVCVCHGDGSAVRQFGNPE